MGHEFTTLDDLLAYLDATAKPTTMPTEAEFRASARQLAELFMLGVVMQTTTNPDFDITGSIVDLMLASYKDGVTNGPLSTE